MDGYDHRMKRTLLAIILAVVTAIGFATFSTGNAGAWKCQYHPEQPTCTTTTGPPVTVNTTIVQSTTSTSTTVPDTTTSTSTTVPGTTTTTTPPVDRPPTDIKLAG